MRRRGFIRGLLAMPAVIRSPGLLMPVRPYLIDAASFDADLPDIEYALAAMWDKFKFQPELILVSPTVARRLVGYVE